jgi:transcriptional regulator with XRE-family HTH domain
MLNSSPSPKPLMLPAETAFYEQLGRRIAERRKTLGITQVQLAEALGIAQQTMAHYEAGKVRFAAALLPVLAEMLQMTIEDLIGIEPTAARKHAGPRKRGPAPKIQRQLERIHALPKPQQRALLQVIDSVLAQADH